MTLCLGMGFGQAVGGYREQLGLLQPLASAAPTSFGLGKDELWSAMTYSLSVELVGVQHEAGGAAGTPLSHPPLKVGFVFSGCSVGLQKAFPPPPCKREVGIWGHGECFIAKDGAWNLPSLRAEPWASVD